MKVNKITINTYKSIKEQVILQGLPVNIFIGQNNCGKGNILDSIEYAFKYNQNNNFLSYKKTDLEIEINFTEEEIIKYQLPNKRGVLKIKNQVRELIFDNQRLKDSKALQEVLETKVKNLNSFAFLDFKQTEEDFKSLYNHPKEKELFEKNLREHFPKISATENAMDIHYDSHGLKQGDRRVTIDRMGSGFRRIFTILLYIFHPEYNIVLIDEPEIHLHPALIKKLMWSMQNSMAGQIFFTTHSPLFIQPITLSQVRRVIHNNNTTKVFSLDKIGFDYQRLIQELNADNLEMFFADKVILVEGVSDRLLIRGLIDKFYNKDKDLKVIQTHGKGNVLIYIELLKVFNIPVAVILDKDVVYSSHLDSIIKFLKIKIPKISQSELFFFLEQYDIYVFPNGDLENNYPKRYQKEDSKTLNALRAANLIEEKEFNSRRMKHLRDIIFKL